MKKTIIIVFITFIEIIEAKAQVTFRPGLRGGVNFTNFTNDNIKKNNHDAIENNNNIEKTSYNYSTKTDFYLGFYGAIILSKLYTFQPEIDYSRQGSKVTFKINNNITNRRYNVSYIGTAIINKFNFNDKFNLHLGLGLDILIENNAADIDSTPSDVINYLPLDLSFILGAGYNINSNFGVEARVKKGILPAPSIDLSDHTNIVFSVGATYTFGKK
jgi:outer membrane protein W